MARAWDTDLDLAGVPPALHAAAARTVDYGVDLVAKRADRAIPRRTGRTAASQTSGRRDLTGYIAYHSNKAPALHDNTRDRHRRGRAKFLESELAGSVGAIRRRAVAEFRAALTGGN